MVVYAIIMYFLLISVCQLLLVKRYGTKYEDKTNLEKAVLLVLDKTIAGKFILFGYISEGLVFIYLVFYLISSRL